MGKFAASVAHPYKAKDKKPKEEPKKEAAPKKEEKPAEKK